MVPAGTNSALHVVLMLLAVAASTAAAQRAPAMFVFGDSAADVGNNNFLPGQVPRANFAFYGVDFPGGARATGRFTNGLNGIDFLAEMMGFGQSPPPVLSIRDNRQVFGGISFASGGSGILDTTGRNMSLSLTSQVDYMRRTVEILATMASRDEADALVARSVYIISTGNGDLSDYFREFGPGPSRPASDSAHKDKFIQLLSSTFQHRIQALYSLGARRFVVFGIAPLGCSPAIRALTPNGDCVEDLNDMSRRFNTAVLTVLWELRSRLDGLRFSFVETYKVVSNAMDNPASFGFTELRQACCGSGRLNANADCKPNAVLCQDRDRWFFWDRVHLTRAACRLVAQSAFSGDRSVVVPVNVKDLLIA